jgi:hypothetical protein
MTTTTSMLDYVPHILSFIAIVMCFYLYKKIQFNETEEIIDKFIEDQKEFNTKITGVIDQLIVSLGSIGQDNTHDKCNHKPEETKKDAKPPEDDASEIEEITTDTHKKVVNI